MNIYMESQLWKQLLTSNITEEYRDALLSMLYQLDQQTHLLEHLLYQSDEQNRYSKPMPMIGMYIALASLMCILAMVADMLHGLRNKKLWFPCKYFTLNAASLTVIAVAIKLPMDLTTPMPGPVDRAAKVGSLSFMCTMMAYLLPSLATMNTKELVTNFIALGILVITLVVNVCIEINTGAIGLYYADYVTYNRLPLVQPIIGDAVIPTVYVGVLLMLLAIYACSSFAILKSKQILESKYQAAHQTYLKDQGRFLTIAKLKQHVRNYWIMAETGSPQFMTACSATTSASGVLCALSTIFHIFIMLSFIYTEDLIKYYNSDYKGSMLVILIIQFIGAVLGTIAAFSRCFAALSFKLSVKWIWNHIKVSKVESYWTHKFSDWKKSSIPFPSSTNRRCKILIHHLKIIILSICIGLQKTVVVACKMITAIPFFFVICVLYAFRCSRWLYAYVFSASSVALQHNHDNTQDLSRYVLQLQDDMEFPERTLKRISKSVNRVIEKAEKHQPNDLMKLIAESRGFQGIVNFDSHHVPPLLTEENPNCWSLPLVTLTAISISLSNTQYNKDRLVRSVNEGLVYVTHVEENLNATDEHVTIQKAARTLWVEVEVYHKWLGSKLQKPSSQLNTARQILQRLRDTAKEKVDELKTTKIGVPDDDSKCISFSANSMYRITSTILLSYDTNINEVSRDELFAELLSMIADILAACLTNLPQVIAMKCHTSAIEKREASVYAAAKLLGETKQIINTLKDRSLPCLNPEELAFIDEWRAYLNHPSP